MENREYNFTPRAQQALAIAGQEASKHHSYLIQPEHLLIGLLKISKGTTLMQILERFDLNINAVEATLFTGIKVGKRHRKKTTPTPSAMLKKVFVSAQTEAAVFKHSYLGTEHLLLGLIRTKQSCASKILAKYGITFEKLMANPTFLENKKDIDYKALYEKECALRVAAELRVARLANALREIIPLAGSVNEIMQT